VRTIDRAALPARLAALVRELPADPAIARFEARAGHGPIRGALRGALRRVVSDFDADGLLGTHPMALFGEASWEDLVGEGGRLLDVGAGSGDVTAHAAGLFDDVVTTEVSGPMARRLRARGLACHRVDLATEPVELGRFRVVALLNVLDRCDRPRSLLAAARDRLEDDGVLVIAVPLPAAPHVDRGSATVDPDEPLGGRGDTFEAALADLVEATIEPGGLTVRRLARAPYLSRGAGGTIHRLDAGVVVAAR